jgi:membrane-associated protein
MGLGYLLGERLKGSIDTYLLPIIGLIIFISLLPVCVEIFRELQTKRHHRKKP